MNTRPTRLDFWGAELTHRQLIEVVEDAGGGLRGVTVEKVILITAADINERLNEDLNDGLTKINNLREWRQTVGPHEILFLRLVYQLSCELKVRYVDDQNRPGNKIKCSSKIPLSSANAS
jgi:hypothetical protein